MPVVPVPELKRKLALLRAYSPRTSWDLLARPFGASPKTVKYWGHGSASRDPDQIPPEALPVLLDLFAEILPRERIEEDVRRLVFGPAERLESEIPSGAAASFAELIARDGQTGTASLFRKREESALVEIEDDKASPGLARLRFGELFRVKFPVRTACRSVATVQGVQRAWAVVPSVISEQPSRRVRMPGLDGDHAPRFMRERRDAGLHRFVCVQAAEPFPPLIEEHLRENTILDKRWLGALAGFYKDLPESRRACHVLTVAIEPETLT